MPELLPHDGVLTRLGVSAVHGVGVFALRPIARGTDVFPNDRRPIAWVAAALVEALPADAPERQLYLDFGIRRGAVIGCPPSFDLLGTGWYLNEPPPGAEPNVRAAADYAMVAVRDIAAGEELTVRYESFSDPPATDQ